MTRASYLESTRDMPLGARSRAWICAAKWSALSPTLTYEDDGPDEAVAGIYQDVYVSGDGSGSAGATRFGIPS